MVSKMFIKRNQRYNLGNNWRTGHEATRRKEQKRSSCNRYEIMVKDCYRQANRNVKDPNQSHGCKIPRGN